MAKSKTSQVVSVKVISGPRQGETFIIKTDGSLLIGRHRKANILIKNDPAVSGKHTLITWIKGNCYIEDLHSTNGTLLNGKPVRRAVIKDEAFITIGSTLVKLNIMHPENKKENTSN